MSYLDLSDLKESIKKAAKIQDEIVKLQQDVEEIEAELQTVDEVYANHIFKVLVRFGGNKTKAAEVLGITVKTLYNKLHEYANHPNLPECGKILTKP